VTFHGEFVDVEDIRFDAEEDDDGHAYPVRTVIGAVRMGMVALAGEIADGVLLDFLVPPSYTATAVAAAREGASRGQKDFSTFAVPQLVATSVNDDDPAQAIQDCKAFLTQYIAQQSHITEFCGAEPELIAAVKAIVSWPTTQESIRRAMELVPDSLVRSVCACGTTAETMDKLAEYVDNGCTSPIITPLGDDQAGTLSSLAKAMDGDL
jgi:5,10-methylenetetrahydromethanopterin reductase